MNNPMRLLGGRQWAVALGLAVLSLEVWGTHHSGAKAAEGGDDGRGILRYAPLSGTLEPVSPQELKVGYIYSHFSQRLNRRVWSYALANGEFWSALGEGTTQEAWRLDIRVTPEQGWELLAQTAPRLARQLQQEGTGHVYLRLTGEGRWVIAEGAGFPTVYNAETGYRWEKHSGRYIPISSGAWRYQWAVDQGRYVPAGRMRGAVKGGELDALSTLETCGCQ
jgi:hypothetical protein